MQQKESDMALKEETEVNRSDGQPNSANER